MGSCALIAPKENAPKQPIADVDEKESLKIEHEEKEEKIQQKNIDEQYFTASRMTSMRLPKQCIKLYNHIPKYEILSDGGGVIFYPSPHLKNDDSERKLYDTIWLEESLKGYNPKSS